jgi:hypothetical protein
MRTETFKQAHMLLLDSVLLNSVERKEWLQLLPEMTEKQGLELIRLLSNHEKPKPLIVAKEEVRPKAPKADVVIPPWKMPVDIKQKELETSIPEYELELPAPHIAPVKSVKPGELSLEELHKKVEHMVEQVKAPIPPKPESAKQPQSKGTALENLLRPSHPDYLLEDDHKHVPKPAEPKPAPTAELVLDNVEDFTRLSPAMIHGKKPSEVFGEILKSAVKFAKKHPSYLVVSNLEQSPLYKTYVDTGLKLLNNIEADRDKAFAGIVEKAMKEGQNFLSKAEFEVFIDFRAQLDKL